MSMRDDLNDAIGDIEDEDDKNNDENHIEAQADNEPSATDENTPAQSDDTPSGAEEESGILPDKASKPVENAEDTGSLEAKPEKTGENDSIKAPVDWSPQQREEWSKVPRHLQEKIDHREKEIGQLMQDTARARETHQYLQNLEQSYAPVLAAEGVENAAQAIDGLFKSVATLRMGTPQQKAELAAQMINTYGVDVEMLDNMLVGQPSQDPQISQLEQMLEQKMAPVNNLMAQMNQAQQQNQQQSGQKAQQDVAEFEKNAEFLQDVRMDMADLLDLSAKHGRQMSIQEAYDRACAVNPEISKVLEGRKQSQNIIGNNQGMAAKRAAASSITGRQSGTGGVAEPSSMRDFIDQAWDAQG